MKPNHTGEFKKNFTGNIPILGIRIISYTVVLLLASVLMYIFANGIKVINWEFLLSAPRNNMTEGGIGPAVFGTLAVIFLMIVITVPLGIFAAVYINEYIKDRWLARIITISINTLAGVPSIVIGLFGLGFFVLFVGKNLDEVFNTGMLLGKPAMLWASATLGVLVLPLIIVTTVEALKSVPDIQRYAAISLGSTRWEMIKTIVLPQARSGILTGIILSISRAAGETAPLLFLGCAFFLPDLPVTYLDLGLFAIPMINPAEQFMYLSYHIFVLTTQSTNPTLTKPLQYGTATVLVFLTLLLNMTAIIYRIKFRKNLEGLRGY
ncbi:MAG: phosphate ABC transporter permease PstA [Melioribacteraceae bacterium]|nr:phosphate ABC transporter permease PstA [Melioribacteraceae bacterium]